MNNTEVPQDFRSLNSLFFDLFDRNAEDTVFNSSDEIDQLFEQFKVFLTQFNFNFDPQTLNAFAIEVKRRLSLKFDYGNTISDGSAEPWTEDCWQDNDRYFWNRYKTYL